MEISGKIIVALPAQGGVSKAGKEWSRQDYVIETKEQYPKKIAFSIMNDNIMNFGLTVGQEVDIHIDINATEWNGKWYNSSHVGKSLFAIRVSKRHPVSQITLRHRLNNGLPHNRHNSKCSITTIRMICLSKKVKGWLLLPPATSQSL